MNQKIILASGSPRRIEMLKESGLSPIVIPPSVDETLPAGIGKEQAVLFLALKKALSVENALLERGFPSETGGAKGGGNLSRHVIIAADTIVYQDRIIGKPLDRQDAFDTLASLRGRSHYVVTGVALIRPETALRRVFYDITEVFFRHYSDEALRAYVDTDEPYDKAGGYAIQGTFGKYIDHIDGNLDNVIGFPWEKIQKLLPAL